VNRLGGATETNIDGTSTYWLRGFQYDQYGNMWTSVNGGVPTWSMMPTSNVFNSANRITGGSYEGAGNQTAIGPYTFQYDAENRLIEASQPASAGGGQVQYGYDAEGKRITKSFLSGPSTVYVYDVFRKLSGGILVGSADDRAGLRDVLFEYRSSGQHTVSNRRERIGDGPARLPAVWRRDPVGLRQPRRRVGGG
jgi:YD repeat-containing protein